MLGYAKVKNLDVFLSWLEAEGWQRKTGNASQVLNGGWYYDNWRNYFYTRQAFFNKSDIINVFKDSIKDTYGHKNTEKFISLLNYLDKINAKMECFYKDDLACIVGYQQLRFVMPTEWFDFDDLKDYSGLTGSQLKSIGSSGASSTLPSVMDDVSKNTLEEAKQESENKLKEMESELEKIKSGTTDELLPLKKQLEEIQKQMQEKQQELMLQLKEKQEAMLEMKKELENQIMVLETQIYGIRCYLGEVVDFYRIRNGKRANEEDPVIVYQKIRYLNEELGKALCLYDIASTDEEKRDFLTLLMNRDDVLDLFAPGPKSISIIQTSRTGTIKAASSVVANLLEEYETYHGKQLAVLIRDGDCAYITWLDDDKIQLSEENVFYNPSGTHSERAYNDTDSEKKSSKKDVISRYFIISVLQGVVDHGKILHFPEKVNLLSPNQKYFIFSLAEGWLKNTKYGMFSDIMDKVNKLAFMEGDIVLTSTTITRDDKYTKGFGVHDSSYQTYNNNRGIGDKNRTWDAYIPWMRILPVNKVLYDAEIQFTYQKMKVVRTLVDNKPCYEYLETKISDAITENLTVNFDALRQLFDNKKITSLRPKKINELEFLVSKYGIVGEQNIYYKVNNQERKDGYRYNLFDSDEEIEAEKANCEFYWKKVMNVTLKKFTEHVYLSAKKGDRWSSSTGSRANMEIESDEIIPLTYLCSDWVKYAITTGNIGYWKLAGATLSYADSLKYLNKMLEYLNEREKAEKEIIISNGFEDIIESDPEWNVKLTDWRIENKVRSFTPYQLKRYIKTRR